jgi:tetratricopeptide (TPR) repeat protein
MKSLLLIVILCLCIHAQPEQSSLESTLAEARTLLTQDKPKEALAKLEAVTSTEPKFKQLLGVAYFKVNEPIKAIAVLTPLVSQLPKDSFEQRETIQSLGMAHYLLGHLSEAIPYFEQTLIWQKQSSELLLALGFASLQTQQVEKGRAAFAQLFQVPADSAAAHLLTAQMLIRVELNEPAEAELKLALTKNPKLPNAYFQLGIIAIQKSNLAEAVAALRQEISLNPSNAMAFYRLGDAYTRQLQWDEAIGALQKSVWLNPFFSGPYILLGKSYLKKRDFINAEGMLRRAIQMDPNNRSAHYMLAQLLQQTGRAEDAKREFAIAEKLQGSNDQPEK